MFDAGGKFVGSVGYEASSAGLEIVPWQSGWWFYTIGNVIVRHVRKG